MDQARKTLVDRVGGLVPVASDSFVNPVSDYDKFKQLLVSGEQVFIDAADQIVAALPRMGSDQIELIISATATIQNKLWYVHAACVAQLLENQPPLPGGRGKKANGDGRNEFIKKKAAELGIKSTKLREDLRINAVFGQRFIAEKSGELVEIPDKTENGEAIPRMELALSDWEQKRLEQKFPDYKNTITTINDGEYIQNFAFVSNDNKKIYSSTFFPDSRLAREYYVVLSKMPDKDDARAKEQEVIKRITIEKEVLSAKALHNEIFVKSDSQGTHFKLQNRTQFGRHSGNVEFTLTEDDFTMFNEIVKLSLDIDFEKFDVRNNPLWRDILAETGDGYRIIQRALQSYFALLKSDPKKWGVERSFDPENYTDERQKAKQNAASLSFKTANKYRLSKEKLDEIEAKVKAMGGNLDPNDPFHKNYEKQLESVERAKINKEEAHAAYLAEENYRVEKIIELDSKSEKAEKDKKKKSTKSK
jgi:hypothetical protein